MKTHLKKLNKGQKAGFCTVFLIWKTISTKILPEKFATPPIKHNFYYLCKLAALHLHKPEPKHCLHLRDKKTYTILYPN